MSRPVELKLDKELTIYQVGKLYEEISNLDICTNDVNLNFANVIEIDSAGLQLCIALKQELYRHSRKLVLQEVPETVMNFFQLFQISKFFFDTQGAEQGS